MPEVKDIKKEYSEILEQLSNPELISDQEKFEDLSKRKKRLEETMEKQKEIDEIKNQIEENKTILRTENDRELAVLAESEIPQLQKKQEELEKELKTIIEGEESEKNEKSRPAIIEIRAGTGGEEAGLFAASLFKMYSKFAASQNWQEKTLDCHQTDLGGFKEIIFELRPSKQSEKKDVFSFMKYEGGVHRVQRIPKTEKSGRVHTSTATVAVLLKPEPTEINIKPSDLKITCFKASGPGGQYVNKTESAIRIVHLASGLTVTSQTERNQLQNKENALAILAARLLEKKEEEQHSQIGGKRKAQIGQAKRAEKIRTYNFPQDRLTDHRIKKSWHNLEEIMEGKLEKIIKTLQNTLGT